MPDAHVIYSTPQALGPYVTSTVGIDIPPNMVSKYNTHAASAGLAAAQCHAFVGDLLAETQRSEFSGPDFYNFDIVAIGFGFHHFDNYALALSRLVERLKPGGVLLITDFLGDDRMKHDLPDEITK